MSYEPIEIWKQVEKIMNNNLTFMHYIFFY